jgi:hypothetical protein
MDGDSKKQNKNKKKIGYGMSNHRNILQSSWVRCNVRNDYELDRVLLDYGFNFLLPVGIILWSVFLVTTIF